MKGFRPLHFPGAVTALAIFAATACLSATPIFALQAAAPSTTDATAQVAPGGEAGLVGTSWRLIAINGHDLDAKVPKAPQMTLLAEGTRIVGFSGCNRFLGTFSLSQDRLSVNRDLVVSRRVCSAGMDAEAEFLKALQSIDSWRIVGGMLELSHEKQVLARFSKVD